MMRRKGLRRILRRSRFALASIGVLLLLDVRASAQLGSSVLEGCFQSNVLFFSTEVSFLTQGPVPPDGNPIVSGGDLLGYLEGACFVCARNGDLLTSFGTTADLGLDAVDVVGEGEDVIAAFSTELDGPPGGRIFRAGDLLSSNGAVIPNAVLLQGFSVAYDVGLDAVHGVGELRDLFAFWAQAAQLERQDWINDPQLLIDLLASNDVDLWISTEGAPSPPTSPAWREGDLLSVRTGAIVQTNAQLLPEPVPAGLPVRGIDFGLDAVTGDRTGGVDSLQISVEQAHFAPPEFGESDLLGRLLSWKIPGVDLVGCFEPKATPLGLDALSRTVPEPSGLGGLAGGIGLLTGLSRRHARVGHAHRPLGR